VPIPALGTGGLLPDGIHECTIAEISEAFGRFQESDRRQRLTRQLLAYVEELKSAGVAKHLIINGSYVTSKAKPADIDLLLVLKDDVRLTDPVPPFQYNVRSKKYIKRHFEFDFFVGFDNDHTSTKVIELFREVKYRPDEVKGFLKIVL